MLFQKTIVRYLFGIGAIATTFALRIWLIPLTGTGAPFVLFFAAVLFFSILGAIAYFGITGILFGPLIFAIAIALLEFYVVVPKEHMVEPNE